MVAGREPYPYTLDTHKTIYYSYLYIYGELLTGGYACRAGCGAAI